MASLLGLGLVACGGQETSGHKPHVGTIPSATDALRPDAPSISGDTPSTPNTPTPPDTTDHAPTPTTPGTTADKTGINPAALCVAELATMPLLLAGTERHLLPDNARPPFLSSTQDPVYGSCIVRVTDNAAHPEAPADATTIPAGRPSTPMTPTFCWPPATATGTCTMPPPAASSGC